MCKIYFCLHISCVYFYTIMNYHKFILFMRKIKQNCVDFYTFFYSFAIKNLRDIALRKKAKFHFVNVRSLV